jgi:hypothetical protein
LDIKESQNFWRASLLKRECIEDHFIGCEG